MTTGFNYGDSLLNPLIRFGRLGSTSANTDGTSRTLSYVYDAAGGRTRITHPGGAWFSTLRDALDRPFWLDSADPAYRRYYSSYRPDGLPAGQSRGNGASTWTSRDSIQRLNGLGHYYGGSGASDVLWLYAHNPASQIRSAVRDNDAYAWTGHYAVARAYTANGLNQYTAAGSANFGYDLNGNLTSDGSGASDVLWLYAHNPASQIRTVTRDNDAYAWAGHYAVNRAYATNGLNQYTAAGSTAFGYDANGNLTSDGSRTYVYDVENRLVSATPGATLSYDPLGRLAQVASGGGVTRFLYDGDALVAEYNAGGTVLRRHVHDPGADVPLVTYDESGLGTLRHLYADHQGSIVALGDTSGVTVAVNRYDEYGIPAASNTGRFQYTGQAWLPELGMYYYKARFYSPTLGRFMQTDPVGYDDQFNLYAYVGNDPVNNVDPTGESDVDLSSPFDHPSLQLAGRDFDIPGAVTVFSHGSPIAQTTGGATRYPSDSELVARINRADPTRRQPVALLGCRLASERRGRAQVQRLQQALGRPVMASTTQVFWRPLGNGWIEGRANAKDSHGNPIDNQPGEFQVFGGSFANFGIEVPAGWQVRAIAFNPDSSRLRVTMTGAMTGSRIRQTRVIER